MATLAPRLISYPTWVGIGDGLIDGAKAAIDTVGDAAGAVVDGAKSALSAVGDAAGAVGETAGDVAEAVGSVISGIADIFNI